MCSEMRNKKHAHTFQTEDREKTDWTVCVAVTDCVYRIYMTCVCVSVLFMRFVSATFLTQKSLFFVLRYKEGGSAAHAGPR